MHLVLAARYGRPVTGGGSPRPGTPTEEHEHGRPRDRRRRPRRACSVRRRLLPLLSVERWPDAALAQPHQRSPQPSWNKPGPASLDPVSPLGLPGRPTRRKTMARIYDDATQLIGRTPLVRINRLAEGVGATIAAKLEFYNPASSVKDRIGVSIVDAAEASGELPPGGTIVEATSGNTGIALAMIARVFGLPIELVMPSNSTRERTLTMQAFGAKVTLLDSIEACRDYAEEKGRRSGYYVLNQFANPDNYRAHYQTTGPEIWRDTAGGITHFVSAMGTTGTIMGNSMFLKEQNPAIQIVGCQPTEGSSIPGIRRWPTEYLPRIYDAQRVDRVMDVSQADATAAAKQLAREEGIFVGMSSGGAMACAVRLAAELDSGIVVFIACDRGDRYLSSDLFV